MELLSSRLCLRRLHARDAAALCAYRSLPEVARYQSWESFTIHDADRLIQSQAAISENTPGTWVQLALTLRGSQELIGDCGIHFRSHDPDEVELGITLAPVHQRSGLAAEALACVLDHLFVSLNKHRVTASVDAKNRAAARLFQRLGFRQSRAEEKVWFKGAWGNEFKFTLLRVEWPRSAR